MKNELALLKETMPSSAQQCALYGVLLAVTLLAMASMAGGSLEKNDFVSAGVTAFIAVAPALFCWAMFRRARTLWPLENSALYQSLAGDSKRIGWVHLITGRASSVVVYLFDGQVFHLYGSDSEVETLRRFIVQRAPHAAVGYNLAARRQFFANKKQFQTTVLSGDGGRHDREPQP